MENYHIDDHLTIPRRHVDLIIFQTECTFQDAFNALIDARDDIINAILLIIARTAQDL